MDIEELKRKRYWSEREGELAVALWRESGESVAAFVKRTGLRRTRLDYWRERLEPRGQVKTTVALAPVAVVQHAMASAITIELRSGRAVRLEGDFNDDVLERVIAIAERAC